MEEKEQQNLPQEEMAKPYEPRPVWQVWAARVGLVIFIIFIILYYLQIAGGGR